MPNKTLKRTDRTYTSSPKRDGGGDTEIHVGSRLRVIRLVKGWSIRLLAEKSNLNANTLSLIENGRTSPSVGTLQRLAQSLQVPITTFFEADQGKQEVVFQKNGSRPRAQFSYGLMEDLGAGMPRYGAEPLIVSLNPGAGSGKTSIVHTGREFVYCLNGPITYIIDTKSYTLEEGDSLLFEAYLPHRWHNPGTTLVRAVLVLCPMDDHDRPAERHFG